MNNLRSKPSLIPERVIDGEVRHQRLRSATPSGLTDGY